MISNPVVVSVGGCAEDGDEDNDSAAAATPLTLLQPYQGRTCGGDDDWYRIDVPAGTDLDVSLFFRDADGDLDLYLYDAIPADPANDWIARGFTSSDDESVSAVTLSGGTYWIRINQFAEGGADAGNNYVLSTFTTAFPDPNAVYNLQTDFRGPNECLEGNDPALGDAFMSPDCVATGTQWRFEPSPTAPGFYRLKTVFRGDGECLEGNDPAVGNAFMSPDCTATGTQWELIDMPGTPGRYQLRTLFRGPTECLESSDPVVGSAIMNPCGPFTGQAWSLVEL